MHACVFVQMEEIVLKISPVSYNDYEKIASFVLSAALHTSKDSIRSLGGIS